jgi:hypothetical protein
VIKEQQGQGAGTGAERVVCWRPGDTNEQGVSPETPSATENAANAAVVASQAAKKVYQKLQYLVLLLTYIL